MGTPYFPKLQHYWNFTIRLLSVISRTLVVGVLSLCRGAVSVFCRPSRLGHSSIWSPQRSITTIMLLYNNTKAMVHSLNGNTDFVDMVARVMQGDTKAPILFVICLAYVLRTSIDLLLEKSRRSNRYPAKTISDAAYADDLALLANTPAHIESLLYSPNQTSRDIDLYVNTDITEFLTFKPH